MSRVIIFVGKRGTGKTTKAQRFVLGLKMPYEVYDYHGDWKRPLIEKGAFVEKCLTAKNKTFVFEDASGFFSKGGVPLKMLQCLARARNANVCIVLCFHSLRLVPLDILDMSDLIVLHNTNDNPEAIKRKFGDWEVIWNGFAELNNKLQSGQYDRFTAITIKLS
jgi:hypothetical protein